MKAFFVSQVAPLFVALIIAGAIVAGSCVYDPLTLPLLKTFTVKSS